METHLASKYSVNFNYCTYGLMQFPRGLVEVLDLSLGHLSKPLRGGKMKPGIHVQWSLHLKNQTALPPLLEDK